MKIRVLMVFFLSSIMIITACKKSSLAGEEDKTVQMMRQKILGYWHLVAFIEETKTGNEAPEIINNDPQNVYFEFFANGRVRTNAEGEDEFAYEVKANNKLMLWNNEQTIIELTDTKLTFKNTATSQGTTYTQTYYLNR